MDIKYRIISTATAYREMNRTYEYIREDLYAEKASKQLMENVERKVHYLEYSPKIYVEIDKVDEVKRKYRRITVKNYIVLYTIDEKSKKIYVSHMYYGRRNYMNVLA